MHYNEYFFYMHCTHQLYGNCYNVFSNISVPLFCPKWHVYKKLLKFGKWTKA